MVIALAGNQNCGKTALFNQLTGSNQRVGNFPGVTVERKEGVVQPSLYSGSDKKNKNKRNFSKKLFAGANEENYTSSETITVVDLPGIYSLSPYSKEEIVSRDYLISGNVDCIINIVDATNPERNFYLTMQLIELNMPMVIALNMMDEVRANNMSIDIDRLRRHIGVPVVPISAIKKEGINELIDTVIEVSTNKILPTRQDFCEGAVHRAIHSTATLIEDHARKFDIPPRFAATKLIEGDKPVREKLKLSQNEEELLDHIVVEMENEIGIDKEAALADMRYSYIERLCKRVVERKGETKEYLRSIKIDKILTNKYLAIPLFFVILAAIFYLTFGIFGNLQDLISDSVENVGEITANFLEDKNVNPIMRDLVEKGIFAGIGSVLSFLPIIVILFFFLSLLEDTGYMARVAFVMDKLLRKIGLSGQSFVPMLMGFGCSVPATMATRTLPSERDRKMTILLIPFMSCTAKVPVYILFVSVFFPKCSALVMIGLYALGIIMGIFSAFVLNKTVLKGKPVPFVMELPNYRMPSLKNVIRMMLHKSKDFVQRAFSVIFVATVVIWFLQSFDLRFNYVAQNESMLAQIGKFIEPIFKPLGFIDWRAPTALLTSFLAKENAISTLAVLFNTEEAQLSEALKSVFSISSALAYLVFFLLYTPCVAAVAAIKNEFNSKKGALFVVFYQTTIAWLVAFAVYKLSSLLITWKNSVNSMEVLLFSIILLIFLISVKSIVKFYRNKNNICSMCGNCDLCNKEKCESKDQEGE